MSSMSDREGLRARLLAPLSDAEDAAINDGIAQDPDNPALTAAQISEMRPHGAFMADLAAQKRRGRPIQPHPKAPVTMRLDADVLAAWKATGPGWQTRMNEALRRAVGL